MVHGLIALIIFGLGIATHGQVKGITTLAQDIKTNTFQQLRVDTRDLRSPANTVSGGGTFNNKELEDRREKAKETFKTQRETFQKQLQTIRDEKKKILVDRLNKNFNEVNKKRTDQMLKYLTKVSEVLDKVRSRAAVAKAKGKDTSSVDAAITKAQGDIDKAKSAIIAQAGKDYTVTISSEDNLRTDVGTTMKSLQGDSQVVRDLVIAAHKSVSDAVRALGGILGENLSPGGSASGSGSR